MTRSKRPARRLLAIAAVAALLATLLTTEALAVTGTKPYRVDVAPDPVAAGLHTTSTITISNDSNQPQLGSLNWTIPSGFTDIANVATNCGVIESSSGGVIKVRNIALAAQTSFTFSYDATAPCVAGDYSGAISAKQSNDYNGPPGNDFVLTPPPATDLTFTVTGSCQLSLSVAGQPAGVQINTNMTTADYDPAGPAIAVQLLDGNGDLAPFVETTVTLGIGANAGCQIIPPCGTLSGDKTEDTVSGVATFGYPTGGTRLSIDVSGYGYTLVASSSAVGIASGESQAFNVQDVGKLCAAGQPCHGQANGKLNTSATYTLDTTGSNLNDELTVGVTVQQIDCANYVEHTDTVTTDFSGPFGKILTMSFQNVGNQPKSSFRICYASRTTGPIALAS